jgi:hypothetical protein
MVGPSAGTAAASEYLPFADRLVRTGLVADPWFDGRPRFDPRPCWLTPSDARALAAAAARAAMAFDEAVQLAAAHPACLDDFFGLTQTQKVMFAVSAPLWHGLARADVFRCDDGQLRICELNCDTPSGLGETCALAETRGDEERRRGRDPNAGLASSFVGLVRRAAADLGLRGRPPRVGVVYPTELTEDFGQIALWRRLFAAEGWPAALGSPYNLEWTDGGHLTLLGEPCDVIIRHYKTDWWGERRPVWRDEFDYVDPEPLARPLAALLTAVERGRCAVLNPFGAVVPQNKRTMAFLWQRLPELSPAAQATVRALIPITTRLEDVDPRRLRDERGAWVLKSDYGCEGDEVVIGADVSDSTWDEALRAALPTRWIVQRRFTPARDAEGRLANHGVFVVAGDPAGIYTRLSRGATDARAVSVPTLVSDERDVLADAAQGDGTAS